MPKILITGADGFVGAAALMGSFAMAWLLVGATRKIALRAGVIDVPNPRSSHAAPTPRGGGLVIVLLVLFAVAVNAVWKRMPPSAAIAWAVGGAVVGVAGLIDDIFSLSVSMRFGLHVIAALLLLAATHGLPPLPTPGGSLQLAGLGWLLGTAVIVWSVNLYNFMDGIDGLAAAQSVFVAGAGAFLLDSGAGEVLLPLLVLAGASGGFLLWNLPPAKIFMGDVGSGFIGFSLVAVMLLAARQGSANIWTWLILNGLFVSDATTTLLIRLLRGERIYQAHRSHVYQRLARRWTSHGAVTLAYSAINVCWCLPWAMAAARVPHRGLQFAAAGLLPLFLLALTGGAGRQDTLHSKPLP